MADRATTLLLATIAFLLAIVALRPMLGLRAAAADPRGPLLAARAPVTAPPPPIAGNLVVFGTPIGAGANLFVLQNGSIYWYAETGANQLQLHQTILVGK
jgi:hypothetical protein